MEPVSLVIGGLIGIVASWGGVWLTQRATDQREQRKRQAEFREEQMKKLYGPILARLVDLAHRWRLVADLRRHQQQIIDEHHLRGQMQLDTIRPAQDLHEHTHQYQNSVFKEVFDILKDNLHLAEPSTLRRFAEFCRYFANRQAVTAVNVPIDATGEEIPTPEMPYPAAIQAFIRDIAEQYHRLGGELRSGQYTQLTDRAELLIEVIEPPVLPVRQEQERRGEEGAPGDPAP